MVIGFWWGLFILSNIISNFAARTTWSAETIEELIETDLIFMVSDAMEIPAALLAILVITRIAKMEDKMYDLVASFRSSDHPGYAEQSVAVSA